MYVWATLFEKYLTLLFCEYLVDFKEVCLHEVTLNFHTHM